MRAGFSGFWRRVVCGMGLLVAAVCVTVAAADGGAAARTNAFALVDLSRFASEGTATAAPRSFSALPSGTQAFHRVLFLAGRPIVVTGLDEARNGEFHPTEVTGIPIGRKARRLHLLHGAVGMDKDGVPMAKLVLHYAGGAEESIRLGYGVHARNMMRLRTEKKADLADPNSQVAWVEADNGDRAPDARLFQTALVNPRPGEVITSVDVVSLFSRAALFIVALSVEEGEAGLPVAQPLPSRKVVREMNEFGDAVYRREFAVRVTDASGGALTNAVVTLSVTDDRQPFSFGLARTDARGVARLPYPPQQTLAFHLLTRAPGCVPVVLSESRTNRAEFTHEFTARLERGLPAGGVVKAADGKPIAGAEVAVFKIVRTGLRDYMRTDYDTAMTDTAGQWTSTSLPAGFEGFSFEVSHPDYRSALYTMPGQTNLAARTVVTPNARVTFPDSPDGVELGLQPLPENLPTRRTTAPRVVTTTSSSTRLVASNALLSATAVMVLVPAIPVSGIVLDSTGQPAGHTEIIFQRNNPTYERRHLKTDAQGRFRVMAAEPGDGAIIVVRNGQTPKYEPLNIRPGLPPLEVRLAPARTLRGRVVDRQQRPVPGAKVRLDEWMGTVDLVRFQALSDDEGRFTWPGAPVDQVMFYVTKTNYYSMRHSLSGNSDVMTLTLNRPPGVAGRVYDAETGKPVDLFSIVKGRKYSTNDRTIHWERDETVRGRGGEYSVRIEDYFFQPEARIMVEAPGYVPQISRGFQSSDSYTNDFALKKGRGLTGIVKTADGRPAANATVVLVDRNESGYMDTAGQFRTTSSGGDFTRSDAQGRFEFSPKLETDFILVSHEQGYAEVKAGKPESDLPITLRPWGRVQGVMRVGDKPEPDQSVRLQTRYDRYAEPGERSTALSLYLKAEPDDAGNFAFEKVPPGERRLYVEYRFKERQYGETPLSHGLPLSVKPGETMNVTLGGTGRKVTGRVKVIGGEQSDVDWRRDVHRLTLILPPLDALKQPDVAKLPPDAQQKAWEEYNKRQREFWQTDAGRARDAAERSYVLVFDTNGTFRVDHVPPGRYMLAIVANDPEEEYYRSRQIGSLSKEVEVPAKAGAKMNEPFDLGALELTIRGKLRIGKPVPSLAAKSLDGQPVTLADYRGRHVLLFFWASYAGTGSYDLQVLKELHNTFGQQNNFAVLGLNLDPDVKVAGDFARNNGMIWLQAHLGEWSQTQVPAAFGVDGIPTGVLIDAEGRLVARNLRGSSMRTAVRNALAAEPAVNARQ